MAPVTRSRAKAADSVESVNSSMVDEKVMSKTASKKAMEFKKPLTEIKLPGFGLPITTWGTSGDGEDDDEENPSKQLSAVKGWQHAVMTNRDRCMLALVNELSDKPDWTRKVFDKAIVEKWKEEALTMGWEKVVEYGDMSPEMVWKGILELRDKAKFYDEHGFVPVLDVSSCVVKSDVALTDELKASLRAAIAPLEQVPAKEKDWHPGSDGKVLDLVHPSLYPLIYGKSRILPDTTISVEDCLDHIGKGVVIKKDPELEENPLWSNKFQWLPCNVSFPDDINAQIDSYVNNLHPLNHKALYPVLEELITRAVPLWNLVTQINYHGERNQGNRAMTNLIKGFKPKTQPPPRPKEEDEDEWDSDEVEREDFIWKHTWLMDNRVMLLPKPKYEGLQYPEEILQDPFSFLEGKPKQLQVIVKLANIHLTPEEPEYDGGSWHIEGQLNEHIVSTALYYYDNYNVTDSRLHFRTKVDADQFGEGIYMAQNDDDGVKRIFGVENGDSIQDLGSVLTREGRLIAFPNGFQHRVGSFKLADPKKTGHRKIVALFLVDPNIPIISTANVPPQQRDWWLRSIDGLSETLSKKLPAELFDMVGQELGDEFPITLKEAKKIREELMEERKGLDVNVERWYEDVGFSFCEH